MSLFFIPIHLKRCWAHKGDIWWNYCLFTGYIPIRTPARKLTATPTPMAGTPTGFFMQTEDKSAKYVDNQPKGNLPFLKPEDAQYFDKLLVSVLSTSSILAFYVWSALKRIFLKVLSCHCCTCGNQRFIFYLSFF